MFSVFLMVHSSKEFGYFIAMYFPFSVGYILTGKIYF